MIALSVVSSLNSICDAISQMFASISSMYLNLCFAVILQYCTAELIVYKLQDYVNSKRSNTKALYTFLQILKLHVLNYIIITCVYFNIHCIELKQRPFNSA